MNSKVPSRSKGLGSQGCMSFFPTTYLFIGVSGGRCTQESSRGPFGNSWVEKTCRPAHLQGETGNNSQVDCSTGMRWLILPGDQTQNVFPWVLWNTLYKIIVLYFRAIETLAWEQWFPRIYFTNRSMKKINDGGGRGGYTRNSIFFFC